MKFTIPLVLVVGLSVMLVAGCADTEPPPSPTTNPAVQNNTPAKPGAVTPPPAPGKTAAAPGKMAATPPTSPGDTVTINGKKVTLQRLSDGLQYYDEKIGTGPTVRTGQTASLQYTGTLVDGTEFDSTKDHGGTPFSFAVGEGSVIRGWDEGIPGMKVGGVRHLVIPGDLAYGANAPSPKIPANATLVFDVELVGVK